MKFNTVSVIGLGYIGLPTAAMFASRKINVVGVDVNQTAVDTINQGKVHIVEPDLDRVVHSTVRDGYLKATTVPEPADAFIIAVPTPFKDDHKPDLKYIKSASEAIAPVLKKGDLVILESTSPVGATERMAAWLKAERPDLSIPTCATDKSDINIAHCPERVLPGKVMRELIDNDRIIGGITTECAQRSIELYKIFVQGNCLVTDARTAEMAKLTENSFRDVNIAFANELSMLCEEQEIDVRELIALANRHPRVDILQPGCGVGGHCIAVDPWFIVDSSPDLANIIRTARNVNESKPKWVIDKIVEAWRTGEYDHIICFGLSFKPDIDDLRESPALDIVASLAKRILDLKVVEPNISELPDRLKSTSASLITFEQALNTPRTLRVFLVGHKEFKTSNIDFAGGGQAMDFCGL